MTDRTALERSPTRPARPPASACLASAIDRAIDRVAADSGGGHVASRHVPGARVRLPAVLLEGAIEALIRDLTTRTAQVRVRTQTGPFYVRLLFEPAARRPSVDPLVVAGLRQHGARLEHDAGASVLGLILPREEER